MASKDLNKVMLTGRLGADPEMRYTPGGNAVTNFRLATNRVTSSGPDGERKEETEWTTIVAWSKLAQVGAEYLHKGDRVYIEGRKQSRSFDGQDGQRRTVTEVIASDLIMLD
ncbi:MAG: single-stranded DNA-binding protein, partial [Chloroflexota bacterium]|nr:single-stranded DNA-binding protein [Chloroflexota bacterium]